MKMCRFSQINFILGITTTALLAGCGNHKESPTTTENQVSAEESRLAVDPTSENDGISAGIAPGVIFKVRCDLNGDSINGTLRVRRVTGKNWWGVFTGQNGLRYQAHGEFGDGRIRACYLSALRESDSFSN